MDGGSTQAAQSCNVDGQTALAAIILKKQCVLEVPRPSGPPFKRDASSTLEALNVPT